MKPHFFLLALLFFITSCSNAPQENAVKMPPQSVDVLSTSWSTLSSTGSSSRKQITLEVGRNFPVLYDVTELQQNELEAARIALEWYKKSKPETDVFTIDYEARGGQGKYDFYRLELIKMDSLDSRMSAILIGASQEKIEVMRYCNEEYIPAPDAGRLQSIFVAEALTKDNLVFHGYSKGIGPEKTRINNYYYSSRGGQEQVYHMVCDERNQLIQGISMYGF
ncbi:MAG: hypothetical protein ACPGWM_02865 [Flavobacteriales bacterium]